VALLECDQALHHHVEVIVRKIVKKNRYFYMWLLEMKTLIVDRINGYGH
jgi:hypothetical protein